MSTPLAFVVLQTRAKIDPKIAQTWVSAVAANLRSANLRLGADGRFSMSLVDMGGKTDAIQGTYTVGPVTRAQAQGKMKTAKQIVFYYDLASLRKSGVPKASVDQLAKSGKKSVVGMQLYYFPDVPVLTDIMTSHFVPANGKAAAVKKLAKWKPF